MKVSVWMPVEVRAPPRSPNAQSSRPESAADGHRGGRPPAFDPNSYRRRNVVERCINRLKQWRGIATRYDKR
jgi:transposase